MCGLSFIVHRTFGTFECDNSPLKFHIPSIWNTLLLPNALKTLNIKYNWTHESLNCRFTGQRQAVCQSSFKFFTVMTLPVIILWT